jgi:hypothetical protein
MDGIVGAPRVTLLLLVRSPAAVLAAHAVEGEDMFVDCGPKLGWEADEEGGGDSRVRCWWYLVW